MLRGKESLITGITYRHHVPASRTGITYAARADDLYLLYINDAACFTISLLARAYLLAGVAVGLAPQPGLLGECEVLSPTLLQVRGRVGPGVVRLLRCDGTALQHEEKQSIALTTTCTHAVVLGWRYRNLSNDKRPCDTTRGL